MFGREMIGKGDAVRYRNRWYEVVRVNAKSVTVQMLRGTATVAYHEISEHRRREERPPPPAARRRLRLRLGPESPGPDNSRH